MGSPRKRIGFLPRTQVQEIIDQLCIEENLSQSKVVGIFVEEALAARGIFDPTQGQNFEANPNWKAQARSLMKKDSTEIKKLLVVLFRRLVINKRVFDTVSAPLNLQSN